MLQMESFIQALIPQEAMKCVAFYNHSGEDQISHAYLILLNQRYSKF